MKNGNKISVSDALLVGAGKSSRLAALSSKVIEKSKKLEVKHNNQQYQLNSDLKPEAKVALEQAINLIDEKVFIILSGFPGAKKNSLFKLRFGVSVEDISAMTFKQVFSLLGLDTTKIRYFRRIEDLDSNGILVVGHDK